MQGWDLPSHIPRSELTTPVGFETQAEFSFPGGRKIKLKLNPRRTAKIRPAPILGADFLESFRFFSYFCGDESTGLSNSESRCLHFQSVSNDRSVRGRTYEKPSFAKSPKGVFG
jgi:hypothetical protein